MARTHWDGLIQIDAAFLQSVYAQTALVPFGRVTTYGKLAELSGYPGASREVGIAMGRVPEKSGLPCHRVVNKNGTLAPSHAFGGPEKQRALLLQEGVTFDEKGLVNVSRHMWPQEETHSQLSMF